MNIHLHSMIFLAILFYGTDAYSNTIDDEFIVTCNITFPGGTFHSKPTLKRSQRGRAASSLLVQFDLGPYLLTAQSSFIRRSNMPLGEGLPRLHIIVNKKANGPFGPYESSVFLNAFNYVPVEGGMEVEQDIRLPVEYKGRSYSDFGYGCSMKRVR